MIGRIYEHGVVKDKGNVEAHFRHDEGDQKALPGFEKGKEKGSEDGEDHGKEETFLPPYGAVGEPPEKGAGNGGDQCRGGDGHAPVGEVFRAGNAASLRKALKVNRKDGGHQEDKSGIANIVEHPVPFFRSK